MDLQLYSTLRESPELFREEKEDIRSDWLYQRYAVLRRPDNLEHCINPSKDVCLNALAQDPSTAECIPDTLKLDSDLVATILEHEDPGDALRYMTFKREYAFAEPWYANDPAVLETFRPLTNCYMPTLFTSTLPSQRFSLIQNVLKEHFKHLSINDYEQYRYAPHLFFRNKELYISTHDGSASSKQ